jgi:hypothetical protein
MYPLAGLPRCLMDQDLDRVSRRILYFLARSFRLGLGSITDRDPVTARHVGRPMLNVNNFKQLKGLPKSSAHARTVKHLALGSLPLARNSPPSPSPRPPEISPWPRRALWRFPCVAGDAGTIAVITSPTAFQDDLPGHSLGSGS